MGLHLLHATGLVPISRSWRSWGRFTARKRGRAHSRIQAGVRWEPNAYANIAFTYGNTFDNTPGGSRLEIGVMLFTLPRVHRPCR